jgi:hypothetical protein
VNPRGHGVTNQRDRHRGRFDGRVTDHTKSDNPATGEPPVGVGLVAMSNLSSGALVCTRIAEARAMGGQDDRTSGIHRGG